MADTCTVLVPPHLDYCDPVWWPDDQEKEVIENLQKTAAIKQRTRHLTNCKTYKTFNVLNYVQFHEYSASCQSNMVLQLTNTWVPLSQTNWLHLSYSVNAPFLWNSISLDITCPRTYNSIKSRLEWNLSVCNTLLCLLLLLLIKFVCLLLIYALWLFCSVCEALTYSSCTTVHESKLTVWLQLCPNRSRSWSYCSGAAESKQMCTTTFTETEATTHRNITQGTHSNTSSKEITNTYTLPSNHTAAKNHQNKTW